MSAPMRSRYRAQQSRRNANLQPPLQAQNIQSPAASAGQLSCRNSAPNGGYGLSSRGQRKLQSVMEER